MGGIILFIGNLIIWQSIVFSEIKKSIIEGIYGNRDYFYEFAMLDRISKQETHCKELRLFLVFLYKKRCVYKDAEKPWYWVHF